MSYMYVAIFDHDFSEIMNYMIYEPSRILDLN